MTQPRASQICLDDTPWYHVVSRCVRRAFLCGQDSVTGNDYEHRRGWIEDRALGLASVFAIDVAAYAVMSNHYHLVLRVDAQRSRHWDAKEVLSRWTRLFSGPEVVQRYLSDARETLSAAEVARAEEYADEYRGRLHDLSWFMRVLNESIARRANAEDKVRGRFWEGRFKSQALLDEQALLAAMSYVDLNPIRAGVCEGLEDSTYTAIGRRLSQPQEESMATQVGDAPPEREDAPPPLLHKANTNAPMNPAIISGIFNSEVLREESVLRSLQPAPLMPFDGTGRFEAGIPFSWPDYVELTQTLGRCVHPTKRGRIPEGTPKLLQRLGMGTETFIAHAFDLFHSFGSAIGAPASLVDLAARRQCRYLRGIRTARDMFGRDLSVAS
jgi:REP element-mobilizing transposase RayT